MVDAQIQSFFLQIYFLYLCTTLLNNKLKKIKKSKMKYFSVNVSDVMNSITLS